MGRRKKNKPQRPRPARGPAPLGVYYDEVLDFPVTIPAGAHTLALRPDADGVESRILLEGGGHIDLPKAHVKRSIGG